MIASTLTSKGQITIPKTVREALHLLTGDKVEFIVSNKNEVILKPITKASADVFGMFAQYKKSSAVSIEEMDQGIKHKMKQKFS